MNQTTQPQGRLAERAVLVTLNISRWEGVANNKAASAEVEQSKGAQSRTTQLRQKLLPGCESHENVLTLFGALRNWHYECTLPWEDRGARLLGAAGVMDYMTMFRHKKAEIETALDLFYQEYQAEQVKAQVRLGDLYTEQHYPTVERMRGMFGVALHVSPLPNGDDLRNFKGFTAEEVDSAIVMHENAAKDRLYTAMNEVVARLREPVEALAARLADPKAVFRDTLVGNLALVVSLMPSLNIMGDERVTALCEKAKALIHAPDTLRANEDLRSETASKAAALARELASVGW